MQCPDIALHDGQITPCLAVVAAVRPGNFRTGGPELGMSTRWAFSQCGQEPEVALDGPLTFDRANAILDVALAGGGLAYVSAWSAGLRAVTTLQGRECTRAVAVRHGRAPKPTERKVPTQTMKRPSSSGSNPLPCQAKGCPNCQRNERPVFRPVPGSCLLRTRFGTHHLRDLLFGNGRFGDKLAQCCRGVCQQTVTESTLAVDKTTNSPLVDAKAPREGCDATKELDTVRKMIPPLIR